MQGQPTLNLLKEVADEILQIALNCHFGALTVSNPNKIQTKEQELLEWVEYEKWLKRQLEEYDQASLQMGLPTDIYENENENENEKRKW